MKYINALNRDALDLVARDQLAFDEAMLMAAENASQGEALRVWEFEVPAVGEAFGVIPPLMHRIETRSAARSGI